MSGPLPSFPLRVALAGAGSVGTIVARVLQNKGHVVTGVWSRTQSSALLAAERLGCPAVASPERIGRDAAVVLIGVADDAIAEVARAIAPGLKDGTIVVHFAGSRGLGALEPVATSARAALHPVQALPDFDTGLQRLPGSAWGVTCSEGLHDWANALVRHDLDGSPVSVAEEDRALWHAAAVMTSNGMAALLGSGMELLDAIGIGNPHAVLGPLAAGTLTNANAVDETGKAFTGPVVRGDLTTLERHVDELRARAPELLDAYRLAAELVVAGALRSGRIDAAAASSARSALERNRANRLDSPRQT